MKKCGTCEWWNREVRLHSIYSPCKFDRSSIPNAYSLNYTEADEGLGCPTWKPKAVEPQDCPFCGGDVVIHDESDGNIAMWDTGCFDCTLCGPSRPTREEAIAAWNRITLKEEK